jgi:hypothetical protein
VSATERSRIINQPTDRLRQAADALQPGARRRSSPLNIANKLGVELGPTTLKTFSNGEVYCRYMESIRGADVFIVQSTCGNPQTRADAERRADGAAA